MAQQLEISNEERPHDCRTGSNVSHTVRAMKTPNGDVEIARCNRNGDNILTVIPRAKRAELAQFLVEND